jgi:hypothetical protein
MKRFFAGCMMLAALALSGCLKDYTVRQVTYYKPLFKTTAEVRADIKSGDAEVLAYPGKLVYKDGFVYLNELMKGVHVIDMRNPAQPVNKAFIKIPGSVDIAVRGNILYADMYTDLVAIDITDPNNVKLKKTVEGVFPESMWYGLINGNQVATEWVRVDTTIRDEDYNNWMAKEDRVFASPVTLLSGSGSNGMNSKGGSMARFALRLDRLYTVSTTNLKVFNTATPENPFFVNSFQFYNGAVETIYPYGNYLFIGSRTGMYLFDANDKDNPKQLSVFEHARVCDPVVADGDYAYVTLRSGNECMGFTNQLDVLDVKNMEKPRLVKSYPMFNPHGLSKDGNTLIICEGTEGLKFMDASNPDNLTYRTALKGMTTFDVITLGGYALVSAQDGLYVVEYTNPASPKLLSSIKINKP